MGIMIKANELRIGNYVNVPREDQSPFRIDLFEFLNAQNCKVGMNVMKYEFPPESGEFISGHPLTWELKDLTPIPLTEDILLKFGAKKQYDYLTFDYDRFRLIWKEKYNYFYVVDNETNAYLNKIEFVHEWQNFVFVMNGNELEYINT